MSHFISLLNEKTKHLAFLSEHTAKKHSEIVLHSKNNSVDCSYDKARNCFKRELAHLHSSATRFLSSTE